MLVRDQYNNLVAGAAVAFAVGSGGGSVTGANPATNGSGISPLSLRRPPKTKPPFSAFVVVKQKTRLRPCKRLLFFPHNDAG